MPSWCQINLRDYRPQVDCDIVRKISSVLEVYMYILYVVWTSKNLSFVTKSTANHLFMKDTVWLYDFVIYSFQDM